MTCLVRSIGCLAAFALAFAPPAIAANELFGLVPGTLYALVRDTIRTSEGLTTVNPADGAASPLGSGISVCCGVGLTGSALDPNGDRFYFLGIPGGESNWRLWSVALSTGAGLNKPQLSDAERYNFLELAPSPLPVELTGFTIK